MADPSLPLNEDVNKCFKLFESFEHNITGIYKLKQEIEMLKAILERRVAVDINQWPVGRLELLEAHAAPMRDNITHIVLPNNIKIGVWGGPFGRSSFDFGRNSFPITRVDLCPRTVVDGLGIHHVVDRDEFRTFRAGGFGGPPASIWLLN